MPPIWKTIEVNGRITAKELCDKGIRVSEYAEMMLKKVEFSKPHKVDLVKITVRELGFERNATTEEIYAKAKETGLELCEAEVAPYLRLDYLDQPFNELALACVAMKPISGPAGYPRVFRLRRGADGVWLGHSWAEPAGQWRPGSQFVFRLSSRKSQDTEALGTQSSESLETRVKILEDKMERLEKFLIF